MDYVSGSRLSNVGTGLSINGHGQKEDMCRVQFQLDLENVVQEALRPIHKFPNSKKNFLTSKRVSHKTWL